MRTLTGTYVVRSVAFDNNNILATAAQDYKINLWDKNTGDLLRTLDNGWGSGAITSVAFDNNNMLVSGSYDGTIKLWGFF